MGDCFSKTVVEPIELRESDITHLIAKLQKEEGQFDSFIKKCIFETFSIYKNEIKKRKKGRRSSNDGTTYISSLIVQATYVLNKFPLTENFNQPETYHTLELGLPEIKRRLFHIEKTLKNKSSVGTGNGYLLKEACRYYYCLSESNALLTQQEIKRISILIFKLYLKSPPTKHKPNVNKQALLEVYPTQSASNEVSGLSMPLTDTSLLKKDGLKKSHSMKKLVTEIEQPKQKRQRNLSIPGSAHKVQSSDKRQNTIYKQKETSKHRENLEDIEKKIEDILESDLRFDEKVCSLENLKKEVNEIDESNNGFRLRRDEIINRLTGYIMMEITDHLRQVKKTVETHKVYAARFPFSYDTDFFKIKFKEIHLLKKQISDLSKRNSFIKARKISEDIDKVLDALETKAKYNHVVISGIKDLEKIENLVTDIGIEETCSLNALIHLNEIRKKINSIDNFHKRIDTKKLKIWSKIQEIERKIYDRIFPRLLTETKLTLNKLEIAVESFTDVYGSGTYKTTRSELLHLGKKVENYDLPNNYKQLFCNTIKTTLEVLEKKSNANFKRKWIEEKLRNINKDVVSCKTLNEEFFENQRKFLDSVEIDHNFNEILDLKTNIQSRINIQTAKIRFNKLVKQCGELKNKINTSERPFTIKLFKEFLNELFSIKDLVDDMPVGDDDLDLRKQKFRVEINNILSSLDKQLASTAMKQKHLENIVNLENRFIRFERDILNVPRNSIEFVEMIRSKAGTFEECAKYYMGSSYSVDYYIIHENLMRLLEELDRVNCDSDPLLLEKTVETITYIKDLLQILSSNVSS